MIQLEAKLRWKDAKNYYIYTYNNKSSKYITTPDLQSLDTYELECVRDIIYNWFDINEKELSQEKKEKIAQIVLKNYNRIKYGAFIDYNFNRKEIQEYHRDEFFYEN